MTQSEQDQINMILKLLWRHIEQAQKVGKTKDFALTWNISCGGKDGIGKFELEGNKLVCRVTHNGKVFSV